MTPKMTLQKISMVLFGLIAGLGIGIQTEAAEMNELVEHETGFYYTVQKGDTLWDLSQKFSDSPWFWPEMWQENKQIANPHLIYPGERIRLFRRQGVRHYAEKLPEPDILQSVSFYYSPIARVGFIRKVPVASHGTIYQVREPKVMISEDDIVYIRPDGGRELSVGQSYTVYRTLEPINNSETNEYIGIQHYLTGVVEIIERQPEYVIGKIIKSYRPIRIDDHLMPYRRRLPRVNIQESQPGIEGRIICSEEHRVIMGDTIIVFIDKGRQDGIKPGQFYSLYYIEKHRDKSNPDAKEFTTSVTIGDLLVLHTEDTTATALITSADKVFEAGTLVRTPIR
jgi:hypothetical protein